MSTPGGMTINLSGLTPTTGGNTSLGTDIGGIYSLIQALMGTANTNAAANAATAFPQQPAVTGAVSSLQQFLANPNSFLQTPEVQSQIQQGVQSASNAAGAAGGANSGGRLAALQSTGQNIAMGDENAYVNQLLGTASLGNPVAAAGFQAQGQQQQATSMAGGITGISNLVAQLLGIGGGASGSGGGLLQAIQKLFGGSGTSNVTPVGTAGSTGLNSPAGSPDLISGSPAVLPVDSGDTDGFLGDLSGLFGAGGTGP